MSQENCTNCKRVKEHVGTVLPFQVLEKITDKPLRIRGVAMCTGISRNLNIYTSEELQAFSGKLANAPIYIEHVAVPNAVGKVTKTDWDGHNLWYEAEIYDDQTAEKIRKGLIQHVSVGADYEAIDVVDGKVPHGLHNAELSLVAVPGIPETNVQVLEKFVDTKVTEALRKAGVQEAEWDTEYINNLPDDCFAYIEAGGQKDDQGKTTPRSLRHLPYKSAQGNLDAAHVRNALARLDQTEISAEAKAQALKKLCAATGELQIESAVCNLQGKTEALQAQLTEAQKALEDLRKQLPNGGLLKNPLKLIPASEAAKMVESVLPSPMVQRSWSLGPQRMCQELRRVVVQLEQKSGGS
ncbi:hypothetical protein G4O51_03075 [Candidatus Bathyarchaeota archaeon A05DMB-2]|jgi:hypothetical protein|nr:hypothetical protein [Candidatus Bathyarchaeota archaeon A05DMB-2]